jgi:hypothetical protein
MIDQPQKLLRYGIYILVAIGLFVLLYKLSSEKVQNVDIDYTTFESKSVGALLSIIVICTFAALGALAWGEVNKWIKDR